MSDTMHVVVYCNEGPDQGLVYLTRALADDEVMNARAFADKVADDLEQEIDDSDGHVGNSAGDVRVEFIDDPPEIVDERYQGRTRIWSGESYYFKRG
jgi:hypothetical protein